jgi:formylglycine-generating enzyme required for sulfatase activity
LGTGAVTQQCSDTVGAGLVISQTPAAGQQAQPGSTVALVVSTGPCPETTMLPGDVPLVLVWVPGGTFQMGCYSGEQDSSSSEDPQHTVTLGGFYMVKYELTKRQWTAVMGTTPWAGQPNVLANQDSPAVCLSWGDAQSFLASLNIYTGKAFRLPSESEWEYACRGGTTSRFHWGDDPSHTTIGNYAWYGGNCSSEQHAHLVGQKLRNAFGLYDMSGNAWEWCEDDWHNDYTNAPQAGQAWVDSPRGFYRVVRGGSWGSNPISCRSAYRNFITPDDRGSNIGFRVVRTP